MPNLPKIRVLLFSALAAATLHAQTHRVDPPEKVIRSIGVYEWTGDLAKPTAARLIPVSLFIDSQFQDGGTYYSRPVPLALDSGNIYSLEKSGIPQGTITLDYARHLQTATSSSGDTTDLGWFGYGTYATMPAERKPKPLQASSEPRAIVSSKDDDRPTFVRRNPDTTTKTAATDTKSTPAPAPAPSAPDDPDRPHFSKAPTPTPASTQAPTDTTTKPPAKTDDTKTTTTTPPDPEDDKDRPTLRHRDPKQAEADRKARSRSSVSAMPGSLNDDPDRPNMRRGKTAGIGGDPAPQLTGMPANLHQEIAVSDPVTREPHPFARDWDSSAEQAEVLTKLQAIAQQQLASYAQRNGVAPTPPPVPAKSKTRTRHTAPTPAVPVTAPLANEEITPYTLSYGGLPTFVYTATSAAPEASPTHADRYVTLVAQRLPSGELQLAFATVTDAAHLDRTPWFRLVDAVDPDAQHRASLLFELRGHTSRQFALYRILSAKATQIFITNPTD